MAKVLHARAKRQAHSLVELFYNDLPADWHENGEMNQFDLELWLAGFDVKALESGWHGFTLLREARNRAERYYQREFKQPHHDPETWAFFRFRLEMALLLTIGVDALTLEHCYLWHDVLAEVAVCLHYQS
ncbi:hypothetical protein [Spirosoma areae]